MLRSYVDELKLTEEVESIQKSDKERLERKGKRLIESLKSMDRSSVQKMIVILTVFSFSHLSGVNILTAFLVDIFASTGISEFIVVVASGFSEMFFSFIQTLIADRLGR